MSNLNKTLIAAAITGLMVVPTANAVDANYFSKSSSGSVKITGQQCKTLKENKLDTDLYVDGGFEGDGPNTGEWELDMFLFGNSIDGFGPLIASNKGRTLNMDLTENGYAGLQAALDAYTFGDFNDGCKNSDGLNYGSVMINKFEAKLSKNGSKAKLKMDAEGTYYDFEKDKDRKVKIKVSTSQMDGID